MKNSLFLTIGCLLLAQVKVMAIPSQITYQGTLKQNGVPTNALKNMTFLLVSADGKTPYSLIISSQVNVINGLFSIPLSFQLVSPYTWDTINPYIQVSVEGQALSPNEPVTTTAYAIVAASVISGAIGTPQLASMAVTSTTIANGAVGAPQLAAMAVTSPAIANGAVGASQLAALAVTSTTIASGAVGATQLAAMAVTSTALANGAVGTPQLAVMAVTSTTIADGAVTWQKIDPTTIPPSGVGLVPVGAIMMFDTNCPAGWTRYSILDGNFPLASPTSGETGGSATHQHLLPIFQSGPTGPGFGVARPQDTPWGGQTYPGTMIVNTFPTGGTLDNLVVSQSSPASSMPPYMTMIFCKKN